MKDLGLTQELHIILPSLSKIEVNGISSVAVKCVEIRKNTRGESGLLDLN